MNHAHLMFLYVAQEKTANKRSNPSLAPAGLIDGVGTDTTGFPCFLPPSSLGSKELLAREYEAPYMVIYGWGERKIGWAQGGWRACGPGRQCCAFKT